jgi:hypothetical protein
LSEGQRFLGGKVTTSLDSRGEFDELFADAPHVHMEMMDDKVLWIGLTYKGEDDEVHITISARGKLTINVHRA